jgi:hypothetical protein
VGGPWGYDNWVEAMANPRHERHSEFREWIGGRFDPKAFNASAATRRTRRGVPNWHSLG